MCHSVEWCVYLTVHYDSEGNASDTCPTWVSPCILLASWQSQKYWTLGTPEKLKERERERVADETFYRDFC